MKPSNDNETAEPATNALLITLADIANGALVAEGSEALKEINDRLRDVAGKALLTIKLAFKSAGTGQVQIAYEITAKTPRLSSPITLAYLSEDGRFLRSDPRQKELPFIQGPVEEIRPAIRPAEATVHPKIVSSAS